MLAVTETTIATAILYVSPCVSFSVSNAGIPETLTPAHSTANRLSQNIA